MEARQISEELQRISGLLTPLGFELDSEQPHISGERFLMTKDKLVLVGKRTKDSLRVIIKTSRLPKGKEEILQEKKARDVLSSFSFSREVILFPEEIYFGSNGLYTVWITEFIDQEKVFVSYPLEKQFFTILRAFEAQEAFHATTFEHKQKVSRAFPVLQAKEYLKNYKELEESILKNYNTPGIEEALKEGFKIIKTNESVMETYCNHLTHTDFVPHNFRIKNNSIYMLDCSAVHFGNKYEGWARFLNYMVIHNPALEKLSREYILKNRSKDEYLNLKLMRIYKIVYLLKFYTESLPKTSGDLHTLTTVRIEFWEEVLRCVMRNEELDENILKSYLKNRDSLRSTEEKKRQKEFAIA
ncbi:MAG: hypothetical protein WAX85_00490 [Minisyncoccia bacterium]